MLCFHLGTLRYRLGLPVLFWILRRLIWFSIEGLKCFVEERMAMFFAFLRTFACASLMLFWSESRASDSAEFKPGALLRKLDDLTLAAIKDRDVLLDQAGIREGVSCDPIIRGYYSKCEGGRRVLGGDLSVMMRWFGSDVENGASSAIYIRNIESVISPEKLVSDYLSGWWEEPQVNRFSEGGSDLYLKGVCVEVIGKETLGVFI